ncbi:unnamed protein product, partial [Meganyctiphanes norvegica]
MERDARISLNTTRSGSTIKVIIALTALNLFDMGGGGQNLPPPFLMRIVTDWGQFLPPPPRATTLIGKAISRTFNVMLRSGSEVSWIRRKDLHVLTVMDFTYTTDARFKVYHVEGQPYWTLHLTKATHQDQGKYECQVSSQPKMYRRFTLDVIVPVARILGSREVFMKAGSDINITCMVDGGIQVRTVPVTWLHLPIATSGGGTLPNSSSAVRLNSGGRGGVQVVTDRHAGTSWLLVTKATWRDAGNYTCHPNYATPATVTVHVLDEETPAAMQPDLQATAQPSDSSSPLHPSSAWMNSPNTWLPFLILHIAVHFLVFYPNYCIRDTPKYCYR